MQQYFPKTYNIFLTTHAPRIRENNFLPLLKYMFRTPPLKSGIDAVHISVSPEHQAVPESHLVLESQLEERPQNFASYVIMQTQVELFKDFTVLL